MTFINNNQKLWIFVAKSALVLAVLCTLGSVSLYYLPDLPRVPRPDLGSIYPVQNHYTIIYWNKTQLRLHRALSVVAISLFSLAFVIAGRLGVLKWRR